MNESLFERLNLHRTKAHGDALLNFHLNQCEMSVLDSSNGTVFIIIKTPNRYTHEILTREASYKELESAVTKTFGQNAYMFIASIKERHSPQKNSHIKLLGKPE